MPLSKKAVVVHSALTEIVEHKEGVATMTTKRAKFLLELLTGTDILSVLATRIIQDIIRGQSVMSDLYTQIPEHIKIPVRTMLLIQNTTESKDATTAETLMLKILKDKSWLDASKLWTTMPQMLDEVEIMSQSASIDSVVGARNRIESLKRTAEILVSDAILVYYAKQLGMYAKKEVCVETLKQKVGQARPIDFFELHVKIVNEFLSNNKKKPYHRMVSNILLTRAGIINKPYLNVLSKACSDGGIVDGACQIVRKMIFLDIPEITGKKDYKPLKEGQTSFFQAVEDYSKCTANQGSDYFSDLVNELSAPPMYTKFPTPSAPKESTLDMQQLKTLLEQSGIVKSGEFVEPAGVYPKLGE